MVDFARDMWTKALYSNNTKELISASPLLGPTLPQPIGSVDSGNLAQTAVLPIGKGRWYVILDASWCGPCKEIAPQVENFRKLVDAQVLRLSVDEKLSGIRNAIDPKSPNRYEAVLDAAAAKTLNIKEQPFVLVVDDGKVTRAEALTPLVLQQLRDEYKSASNGAGRN